MIIITMLRLKSKLKSTNRLISLLAIQYRKNTSTINYEIKLKQLKTITITIIETLVIVTLYYFLKNIILYLNTT